MARTNLRPLAAIVPAALFFAVATAVAAPPTGNTSAPPGVDRSAGSSHHEKIEEIQSIGVDRQLASFAGTVLDVNDRPLASVQVKLFIDGQLAGTALTETNGHYDLRTPYDPSQDATVLLWFVAHERGLMAKELVIRESKASLANGLISKCVPRAAFTPGRQFRVYMFDPESRNKELAEADCLP
ncbi:MAG TPA: hypothetical protein VJW75_03770 [Candidatus Eisenbacteria bacterium]|nr:hypothetical protein [Candidatus Eisenbacteria bacterium]